MKYNSNITLNDKSFTLPDGGMFESTWGRKDFENNGFIIFSSDRTIFSGVPYFCVQRTRNEKDEGVRGWFEIYFDGDTVIKIQEVGEFLDKTTIYKNKSWRYWFY